MIKKSILKILLIPLFFLMFLGIVSEFRPVRAQFQSWCEIIGGDCDEGIGTPQTEDQNVGDVANRIGGIITLAFSLLGVIFIGIGIYGAILISMSGTNQEQKEKGVKTVRSGAVGLIISFASYLLIGFIIGILGLKAYFSVFFFADDILGIIGNFL
jgi:hypothetical protein